MAKFKVNITQHNLYTYVLEADNSDDAKEKAYEPLPTEVDWITPDTNYRTTKVEEL